MIDKLMFFKYFLRGWRKGCAILGEKYDTREARKARRKAYASYKLTRKEYDELIKDLK